MASDFTVGEATPDGLHGVTSQKTELAIMTAVSSRATNNRCNKPQLNDWQKAECRDERLSVIGEANVALRAKEWLKTQINREANYI
jgi:hypothetical protein